MSFMWLCARHLSIQYFPYILVNMLFTQPWGKMKRKIVMGICGANICAIFNKSFDPCFVSYIKWNCISNKTKRVKNANQNIFVVYPISTHRTGLLLWILCEDGIHFNLKSHQNKSTFYLLISWLRLSRNWKKRTNFWISNFSFKRFSNFWNDTKLLKVTMPDCHANFKAATSLTFNWSLQIIPAKDFLLSVHYPKALIRH